MSEQLDLLGLDALASPFELDAVPDRGGKLQGYELFLALFPEPEDAHRLAGAAAELRRRHGLAGALLAPERMHVTLHAVAGFVDTVPQGVVDAALAASARMVCAPLPIVLDDALSFTESDAFVLRCDPASDAAIARLRQPLALELQRNGLHPKPSHTPHMTMLYDRRHVNRHATEPIGWTARRFALILSHRGIKHHQWVAQWALVDRP